MPPGVRQAMAELVERAKEPRPEALAGRLRLEDIKKVPEVFQPRMGMSQNHVEDLGKALRDHGELDPILVMQVGPWPVLIDGHHRWEAYEKAKGKCSIPVRYFEGSLTDAIAEAGRENSKAKLQMQPGERQDYAWKLTRMRLHSIKDSARASGVSEAQISIMRKVLEQLGAAANTHAEWWRAKRAARDLEGPREERDDSWLDAQAQGYADRLYKVFGTKLTSNPDLAARALRFHFGEHLDGLVSELTQYSDGEIEDEGKGADPF
jgi:ParB-like chromosome segregation protein Spo0J